jgi:hypothetical protein
MNEEKLREAYEKTDAYAYASMVDAMFAPPRHFHPPDLTPCDCTNHQRLRIDLPPKER